jgi:hypothetical protein
MKITITASHSTLELADLAIVSAVYNRYSFTDRAALVELKRFKESLRFREKSLITQFGELPDEFVRWRTQRIAELQDSITVYCTTLDGDKLVIPNGLISSLLCYVHENYGIKPILLDQRDFDNPRRLLKGERPKKLRTPQEEALCRILGDKTSHTSGMGLIRLATGVGKTALAQELIREIGVKAIFLVPSLPILNQTVKRFESAFGKKNVRAYGGGSKNVGWVTVATYQSVYAGDPKDFEEVRLAIFDEVHHIAADTFFDVATNKLAQATRRYGLTAFEERADGATLLVEAAAGPVIYAYDAPEAIRDGYLARPTFVIYDVLSTQGSWTKYKQKDGKRAAIGVEPSTSYAGDNPIKAYRNWVLGNDRLNAFVAAVTQDAVSDGKSVLILVDEKEHGEKLISQIPEAGFAFGGSSANAQLQRDFNSRKLRVLIGTSTLGEGADTVPVDILINLQGGASKSKTLQANGRALRNDPDENGVPRKPEAIIIDFNYPKNQLLARQSAARERVHRELGQVLRGKIE